MSSTQQDAASLKTYDAQIRQASEDLAAALDRGDVQGLTLHLRGAARLRRYSTRNRLLIGLQDPGARAVLPEREWRALGRELKPDARALLIYQPRGNGRRQEPGEEREDPVYFGPARVYSASETLGPPLQEGPSTLGSGSEDHLWAAMRACPHPVRWGVSAAPDHAGGALLLPPSTGGADDDLLSLLHAWALLELDQAHPGLLGGDAQRRTEAELAAMVVLESLGVRALQVSADRMALWGGNARRLRRSLTRVGELVDILTRALGGQ